MLSKFIYAVFCAETTFCSKPLIGFSFHARTPFRMQPSQRWSAGVLDDDAT